MNHCCFSGKDIWFWELQLWGCPWEASRHPQRLLLPAPSTRRGMWVSRASFPSGLVSDCSQNLQRKHLQRVFGEVDWLTRWVGTSWIKLYHLFPFFWVVHCRKQQPSASHWYFRFPFEADLLTLQRGHIERYVWKALTRKEAAVYHHMKWLLYSPVKIMLTVE